LKISIVHDSQLGNGRKLAEYLGDVLRAGGAEVRISHQAETQPEEVREFTPDLLIVGAAVRRFMTGPASKRWVRNYAASSRDMRIARAAVFITHIMSQPMVERRATRFIRKLESLDAFDSVYPGWLSGRVKEIAGPFIDGTMERADEFAREITHWAATPRSDVGDAR